MARVFDMLIFRVANNRPRSKISDFKIQFRHCNVLWIKHTAGAFNISALK